jgi:TonB family protein
MKNYFILTCIMLTVFIAGIAFAQEPLVGAAANLFKPEPLLKECKMPVYPEVKGDTIATMGKVIVLVSVNDKGEVVSSSVKRESPKGFGFGASVAKVIDDWSYLPAYWNGKPTSYSILETFRFNNGKVEYEPHETEPAKADTTQKVDVKISE